MNAQLTEDVATSPIWIDVDSKKCLAQLCLDLSLTLQAAFNNPTIGCHHIQNHVHTRAEDLIKIGVSFGVRGEREYGLWVAESGDALLDVQRIGTAEVSMERMINTLELFLNRKDTEVVVE